MSNTTYLAINSINRSSGSSHSFMFRFPSNIKNVKKVSLLNAEIPMTMYTVRSGVNNTFTFTRSAVSYTATVTEGVYTASTLFTALATAMTTADSSTTFSFATSSTTLKATLTASNSITISDTILSKQLGFTSGQSGTSITATNAYVVGDTHLFIQLKNLSTNMLSTVPSQYRIQLTADIGYIQFLSETSNPQQVDTDTTTLNYFDVALVDSNGYFLSLNGAEWSMLLEVKYEEGGYASFPAMYHT